MAERRDHAAIKLFGQTILIQEEGESPATARGHGRVDKQKIVSRAGRSDREEEADAEEEETEDQQREVIGESLANNSSGNNLIKKSEKIVSCPRCNSKETKFCYYNNYSLNQPRHFCKNCLRFWTAGGAMRNLPVGAGSRRNKNSYFTAADQNFLFPSKSNRTVPSLSSECHKADFATPIPYLNEETWPYGWSFPIPLCPVMTRPPLLSSSSTCSELNNMNLGKHSREGNMLNHRNLDQDDSRGLLNAFQSKEELKDQSMAASLQIL